MPSVAAIEPGGAPQFRAYLGDSLGVALSVGEDQRRAPGAAVKEPALDAQVLAQPLHVGDEVVCGVVIEADSRVGGMRTALTTATLIEQDDPIDLGSNNLRLPRRPPLPGPLCTHSAAFPSGWPLVSQ
jgi:hypothetical protein